MKSGILLRSSFACVLIFAASAAVAQSAQDTPPAEKGSAATPDAASKSKAQQSGKKTQNKSQAAKSDSTPSKLKAGQYATESEARAHCQGTVVWVDKDNFNHYAGSREYGRQPGAFTCERG